MRGSQPPAPSRPLPTLTAVVNDAATRRRLAQHVNLKRSECDSMLVDPPWSVVAGYAQHAERVGRVGVRREANIRAAALEQIWCPELGAVLSAHDGGAMLDQLSTLLDGVEEAFHGIVAQLSPSMWRLVAALRFLHRRLLILVDELTTLQRALKHYTTSVRGATSFAGASVAAKQRCLVLLTQLQALAAVQQSCPIAEVLFRNGQHSEVVRVVHVVLHGMGDAPLSSSVRSCRLLRDRLLVLRRESVEALCHDVITPILEDKEYKEAGETLDPRVEALLRTCASIDEEASRLGGSVHDIGELIPAVFASLKATTSKTVDDLFDDLFRDTAPMASFKRKAGRLTSLIARLRTACNAVPPLYGELAMLPHHHADQALTLIARALHSNSSRLCTLPLESFTELAQQILAFEKQFCEVAGQGIGLQLHASLVATARRYLELHHQKAQIALTQALDKEVWAAIDLPPTFSDLLRNLAHASDENESVEVTRLLAAFRPRLVTQTAVLLLRLIAAYLRSQRALSRMDMFLSADVTRQLCELMHTFNSKMYVLVLRQDAVRLGALPSISARHLCAVYSVLDLFALAISLLKESTLLVGLRDKEREGFLGQLCKLEQNVHEHRMSVLDKFVWIIANHIRLHAASVPELVASLGSLGLQETLKKMASLRRAIAPYLTESDLARVLADISHEAESALVDSLSEATLREADAREILLGEIGEFEHALAVSTEGKPETPTLEVLRGVVQALPVGAGSLDARSIARELGLHVQAAQNYFRRWDGTDNS